VLVGTVLDRTDWLSEVRHLTMRGVLVPRVAETYPLEQAADAQRRMEAGGLRGRAVIVFAGDR
jgi:D-arabinose 1-dehydrogenase-like Zn-dependent alcohol dehydrogenase